MIRKFAPIVLLAACASDYKVSSRSDIEPGISDFFDTGISDEPEDTGEEVVVDPDAPVAVCDVTPDKVRPIVENARWIGSESYDPNDLAVTTYRWTLVDKPIGSASTMPSGTTPDLGGFTPDLAGDYVGRLVVSNEAGVSSDPCETTLTAEPVEAMWIEMFWENSGDDMDLHLLAPGGTLNADTDCYYGNCTPTSWTGGLDWGVIGDTSDNPTLDLDDISLTGPENINIESPEDVTYTVVVHDYPGSVFTAANAVTVNIYLDGSLEWTDTRMISGEDSNTYFANINVAEGIVESL
jgi:hypothetical protein